MEGGMRGRYKTGEDTMRKSGRKTKMRRRGEDKEERRNEEEERHYEREWEEKRDTGMTRGKRGVNEKKKKRR